MLRHRLHIPLSGVVAAGGESSTTTLTVLADSNVDGRRCTAEAGVVTRPVKGCKGLGRGGIQEAGKAVQEGAKRGALKAVVDIACAA